MLLVAIAFALGAQGAEGQPPKSGAQSPLRATSWRLITFQGSDDTVVTPDDRMKYAVSFGADGSLTARIDCNRVRGTWKSSGPSQVQVGPLVSTKAQCAPGSMHDRMVRDLNNIRSYVIKDGHLFLSLMADGGVYEFEPFPRPKR